MALLGPRQCGKSTLARKVLAGSPDALTHLDLERPSDLARLRDPEAFFAANAGRLICLDEIQRAPELFPVLRSVLDAGQRNGQLLALGSASPELLRQSSESLAGRVCYLELPPLPPAGAAAAEGRRHRAAHSLAPGRLSAELPGGIGCGQSRVARGIHPHVPGTRPAATGGDRSRQHPAPVLPDGCPLPWRTLERLQDRPRSARLSASPIPPSKAMCERWNVPSCCVSCRRSRPTSRSPLVKTPKVFLRDAGLLHTLLRLETDNDLLGHPVYGSSWEGYVLERVLGVLGGRWEASFFRTSDGSECDLVLQRGRRRLAIECKASSAPELTPDFHRALEYLRPETTWGVAPVREAYPVGKEITVIPLPAMLDQLSRMKE